MIGQILQDMGPVPKDQLTWLVLTYISPFLQSWLQISEAHISPFLQSWLQMAGKKKATME